MHRFLSFWIAVVTLAVSPPTLAHITGSAQAHWHAGDLWGLLAVLVLTAGAAWLGRRSR